MCVYYTMYVYADVQKVLHSARVQGLAPDLTVTIRWEAEIQITLQGNVLYQLHISAEEMLHALGAMQ